MGKEDWSNFDRPEPFCDKVWGGSRSRSPSPEPSKRHLEVHEEMVFANGRGWKTKRYYVYIDDKGSVSLFLRKENILQKNKYKK